MNEVDLDIKKFTSGGIHDTYKEPIWIEDEFHPDGGSYQTVRKYYENPVMEIDFCAVIKSEHSFEVGDMLFDGENLFYVKEENTIVNTDLYVESFKPPESLMCVYKSTEEKND